MFIVRNQFPRDIPVRNYWSEFTKMRESDISRRRNNPPQSLGDRYNPYHRRFQRNPLASDARLLTSDFPLTLPE